MKGDNMGSGRAERAGPQSRQTRSARSATDTGEAATNRGGRRRERILDVAKDLLLRGGPSAVVFRDIAAQIGTTHGNLQHYFPTRMDLVVAVCDREVARYTRTLQQVPSRRSSRIRRLRQIIDSGFGLSRSPDALIWRVIVGMVDHSPEMRLLHRREIDAYGAALSGELALVYPELSESARRQAVHLIQTAMQGLTLHYVHADPDTVSSRALESRLASAIVELVDAGA
jgi:AcrR family transcriptional regulator